MRECFTLPPHIKDLYSWQSEFFAALDREEPRIAVYSGHGVAKTTSVALALWHRILTRFPQKSGVTAPSERQLHDALWSEFKAWGERLKPELRETVDIKANSAHLKEHPSESFISIKTARADQPEALHGLHSEWELVVIDEASGVPDATWEAAQSCLTGPHPTAILTGNPLYRSGFFYEALTEYADLWFPLHVSRAAIVDLDADSYAKGIERESGGRHTNRYKVRVLGEFPTHEDDVVIPFELVESALTREVQVPKKDHVIWGVQCPRYGNNRATLAKRQTKVLLEPVKFWALRDGTEIAAKIKIEWDETPDTLRPMVICVYDVPVGGAVVAALRAVGLPAKGVNPAEMPSLRSAEHYANLETELWIKGKDWFTARDCQIPATYKKTVKGEDLVGELTRETYDFTSKSAKMQVTPQSATHDRDLAAAFILTFAGEAVALMRAQDRDHAKPVERQLVRTW